MKNVEEVSPTGPDTTHWVIKGPLGYRAEFDAKTTQDKPNEALGWNSENGDVQTSGQVRFEELSPDRTRVEVQMNYWDTPGGARRRGGVQGHVGAQGDIWNRTYATSRTSWRARRPLRKSSSVPPRRTSTAAPSRS